MSLPEPEAELAVTPSSSSEKLSPEMRHPKNSLGWFQLILPYFLSAFFFFSAFFAILAPLPLLFTSFKKGRKWAFLAALTNCCLIALAGGTTRFLFYLIFVVTPALSLPEFLRRKMTLEKATTLTLLSIAGCVFLFTGGYGIWQNVNPFAELNAQVTHFVDLLVQSVSTSSTLVNTEELEEWKQAAILEFPSAIAIFSLALTWLNLVLLLRLNPNQLRESLKLDVEFVKKWKAPELLVWPVILTGCFLVVDFGIISSVSLNLFKFLMAIYALQGLSILSYFFDLWGVRGVFRWVGLGIALILMTPLVLSLGFFDLWFDFRSKFRQS